MERSSDHTCRVDPPHLIMPTLTALPQRCIITNEEVPDELYEVWDLPAIPRWLVLLMYFGGAFFLISAPYVRKRCKVKAGFSKRARRNRLLKRALMVLVIFSPLLAFGLAMTTRSVHVLTLAPVSIVASYVTLVIFVRTSKPLIVRSCHDGLYWVDGCSEKFLSSLNQETCA
jgi:hypothetical protein